MRIISRKEWTIVLFWEIIICPDYRLKCLTEWILQLKGVGCCDHNSCIQFIQIVTKKDKKKVSLLLTWDTRILWTFQLHKLSTNIYIKRVFLRFLFQRGFVRNQNYICQYLNNRLLLRYNVFKEIQQYCLIY